MSSSSILALNHHPTNSTPTPTPLLPPIPSLTHTPLSCPSHNNSSSTIITNNLISSCNFCNNNNINSSSDTSNCSRNPNNRTSSRVYSIPTIWNSILTHPRLPRLPLHLPLPL